jgi:hypothetical protein
MDNSLQRGFDILVGRSITLQSTRDGYYLSYGGQVSATYRKYLGLDKFGSSLIKTLVDIRSTFIAGNGIIATADEGADLEAQFVQDFIKKSKLDGEFFTDIVRYGELEGKGLLLLKDKDKFPVVRHLPWNEYNYTVNTDPTDYEEILSVTIPVKGKIETIEPDKFTYIKLGGVRHQINETTNRVHLSLTDCEQIDRAINDWANYNSLYGLGYPYWETNNWDDAADIALQVTNQDWKPGKSMAAPAKHYYVEPSGNGLVSIESEIKTRLKKISGTTCIPPHFLGFTDLLANRSTAEQMLEQISVGISDERNTWQEKMYELVTKAMIRYNVLNGTNLDPEKINISIPVATQEQIQLLFNVYVPMANLGFISKSTVQNMIPNIDADYERREIAKENASSPDLGKPSIQEIIDKVNNL